MNWIKLQSAGGGAMPCFYLYEQVACYTRFVVTEVSPVSTRGTEASESDTYFPNKSQTD